MSFCNRRHEWKEHGIITLSRYTNEPHGPWVLQNMEPCFPHGGDCNDCLRFFFNWYHFIARCSPVMCGLKLTGIDQACFLANTSPSIQSLARAVHGRVRFLQMGCLFKYCWTKQTAAQLSNNLVWNNTATRSANHPFRRRALPTCRFAREERAYFRLHYILSQCELYLTESWH